ncbi:GGDEF domain-containing protein [Methylomarinum vadi]|uniref:GGDEF domain-containing protein n=1 Tax=Methylomarinum vadi TaxID=438855 RepID=UPI0004DF8C03|nr:GGDEF domain-containing protein [Methylomarinum vadi]
MTEITTFLPSYDPCPEYNAQLLRQSVPLMMKHRVSAHPINYAIWYEYVAGNNRKLNAAIDDLINQHIPLDDKISLNLYKTYICNASVESFEKINFDLQALIDKTTSTVQNSGNQVASFSENVQVDSLKLEEIDDLSQVKTVLSGIVAETQQLLEISNTLKSRLYEANQELASLRDELTKVREMATTDALTGLINRRAFDNVLHELVANSIDSAHCLLILDLDHFKKVNDTFGHLIGDKVLRFTAGLIKNHVAEHHLAARYGGEEMAVVMPNTHLEEALAIAEQIRIALASNQLKQKDNGRSIGKVTVSIGATSLKIDDSPESFIARADNALYTAKKSGRNKVVYKDN